MKFKHLTEVDVAFITAVHKTSTSDDRDKQLSEKYQISPRTVRRWISRLKLAEQQVEENSPYITAAKSKKLKKSKYYIITSAQNATLLHDNFWTNIVAFSEYLDASIHVIPYRYKNPTAVFKELPDDWWDDRLTPFLDMNRHNLHKNLQLLSDVKIQPTATNPLQGLQGFTGSQSCIVGHPKMQLKSVPTLEGYHNKIMCTTGACTLENYTDSKAGKRGEFHHIYGFVIVEIRDEEIFYIRQVSAKDDGNFIDLNLMVVNGNVSKIDTCKGWRLGDIHVRNVDSRKIEENISVMTKLFPEKIVLDDIFDGETVNPHTKDDHVAKVKMVESNKHVIEDEISEMIEWLADFKSHFPNSEIVITKANHDVFADRFMNYANWKKDYVNAKTILKLQAMSLESDCRNGIIPYLINKTFHDIICLDYNDSYVIGNTECSQHGQFGSNGSRGSAEQFRNLSMKMCTAHSHSICRMDGLITVGTSTKRRLSYTHGASGWIHADVIFDNFDKAQQIIFMEDYRFTTFFD